LNSKPKAITHSSRKPKITEKDRLFSFSSVTAPDSKVSDGESDDMMEEDHDRSNYMSSSGSSSSQVSGQVGGSIGGLSTGGSNHSVSHGQAAPNSSSLMYNY